MLSQASIAMHWRAYWIEGIVLMVLGVGAILVPIFASVAAASFLGWPFLGAVSFTLVLAAYLAADGVISILFSILFAVEYSRWLSRRWGWRFPNGVVDLVLTGLIVWMPVGALWGTRPSRRDRFYLRWRVVDRDVACGPRTLGPHADKCPILPLL